jgi:glutamine cyclotransferase
MGIDFGSRQQERSGRLVIRLLILVCVAAAVAVAILSCAPAPGVSRAIDAPTQVPAPAPTQAPTQAAAAPDVEAAPAVYSYRVVNVYPHDAGAFTQGLVFQDGILYEGTGLWGRSTLRKVKLETGQVLQLYALSDEYFGEGIAVYSGQIVQLTWRSHIGFVYDRDSFVFQSSFAYPTEGWGLTHDGTRLIMSDGTATLHFWDPETFEEIGQVQVHDDRGPVTRLNELEYVQGQVYANVWQTDLIAIVDPQSGQVTGWIDLWGLLPVEDGGPLVDVLNGIAYDAAGDRLFVTGKLWPKLFEIELVSVDFLPLINR